MAVRGYLCYLTIWSSFYHLKKLKALKKSFRTSIFNVYTVITRISLTKIILGNVEYYRVPIANCVILIHNIKCVTVFWRRWRGTPACCSCVFIFVFFVWFIVLFIWFIFLFLFLFFIIFRLFNLFFVWFPVRVCWLYLYWCL